MCSCGDYSQPSVYRLVVRTARKRHCCTECRGLIEPGSRYQYSCGVWDGEWASHKTCLDCVQATKHLECFAHTALREELVECFDIRASRERRSPDDQKARDLLAGMIRRRRHARRVRLQEVAA